jgi:2-polyprenyl-3-methyl-5-hydroxy-6-metoxy-1,4-benzoquinol methylase
MTNRDRRFFYTTIADSYDRMVSPYDLERRLELVFDELLPASLTGQRLLEVGCGTGWFSQRAWERGAEVTALDMGDALLRQAMAKSPLRPVAGDAISLPLGDSIFDIVISSEVIEHTVDPARAVREMARVLKPGGTLALTCPNRLWQWSVDLAACLRVRPFAGYENFPGFTELERMIADAGLKLERHIGFHPWPFQVRWLWKLSRAVDRRFGPGIWGRLMINQAVRASKRV